ncbi:MAG: extracellular solute-binding protein [Oscillospiraceae bacterium]|nr:extracellular solute-binding protein [Oscillospiraceae bacterium]
MWKALTRMLLLLSILCLTACAETSRIAGEPDDTRQQKEPVEITLWAYQVGDWGNPTSVSRLLTSFRKAYPDIRVSVEYLNYDTGDTRMEKAIASGTPPDLVLESPERLVTNWGSRGLMLDLTDLWEESGADIYESVRTACRQSSGEYYVYPICMSAHCMAVNYDLFRAADALQYLDEENHTWTAEGFASAVQALRAYGQEHVGAVYCGGQGGDQGTRALVNNLYGGSFTDEAHTRYVVESEENIQALQLLYELDGIDFEPELNGNGEIDRFCQGELAMAFCWNCSFEISRTVKKQDLHFTVLPMTFPTSSGQPKLQGGIWGFGVFDSGDAEKIEAAKSFIRFIAGNDSVYSRAVQIAHFWPVKDMQNLYENDALMTKYSQFIPYVGDYYQITPNWTTARTAWWTMLQKIGAGEEIRAAVREFSETANQND